MSIYSRFCREVYSPEGQLLSLDLDYPKNFNFAYDVLDVLAAETPEARALVWCNARGEERVFNFRELSELSNKAANVLRAQGVGRGDTVLVMLKRHYEYWIVALALHKLGAVLSPVTHMLTVSDLRYRIVTGKIHAAVCTNEEDAPARFLEAREGSELKTVFTIREDHLPCVNLTQEMETAPASFARCETQVSDPMFTYFTSGTTGQPKGVVHDHSYPLAHIVTARYWHQAGEGDLHFTVAETGWAKASWGKFYGQWLVGAAVMVFDFDSFDPRALMNVMAQYAVSTFCAPPTIYRYMLKTGLVPMPALRHLSTAGEALSSEIYEAFLEQTGLAIHQAYGQTETTPILAQMPWIAPRAGSMGTPTPLYRVQLQNPDGSETPQGEIGEIVIAPLPDGRRPEGIFSSYFEDAPRYAETWRGGVYHTGDTAYCDADGYYFFHGRADDIIKTGGYRVGPFEIENILLQHPAVLECSVLGVPDPLRGQAIKAYVLLAPEVEGTGALKREIKVFCNERSADYKWIRHIDFVTEFPKTISGKVKKRELPQEG